MNDRTLRRVEELERRAARRRSEAAAQVIREITKGMEDEEVARVAWGLYQLATHTSLPAIPADPLEAADLLDEPGQEGLRRAVQFGWWAALVDLMEPYERGLLPESELPDLFTISGADFRVNATRPHYDRLPGAS